MCLDATQTRTVNPNCHFYLRVQFLFYDIINVPYFMIPNKYVFKIAKFEISISLKQFKIYQSYFGELLYWYICREAIDAGRKFHGTDKQNS